MNRFHTSLLAAAFAAVAIAPRAEARLGERYSQCVARYGNSWTNFPGLSHLLGVAVFEKDGIDVAVAYDRPNRQGFMVIYSSGHWLSEKGWSSCDALKEGEIDKLMESLSVTWNPIDMSEGRRKPSGGKRSSVTPPATPSARPVKKGGAAPMPPRWQMNLEAARCAIRDFTDALGGRPVTRGAPPPPEGGDGAPPPPPPEDLEDIEGLQGLEDFEGVEGMEGLAKVGGVFSSLRGIVGSLMGRGGSMLGGIRARLPGGGGSGDGQGVQPYRRCGERLFAFKIVAGGRCRGLVLINSDAAKDISGWAEAFGKGQDSGRELKGF